MQRMIQEQLAAVEEMHLNLLKKSLGKHAGVMDVIATTMSALSPRDVRDFISQRKAEYAGNEGVLLAIDEYLAFLEFKKEILSVIAGIQDESGKQLDFQSEARKYIDDVSKLVNKTNTTLKDLQLTALVIQNESDKSYDSIITAHVNNNINSIKESLDVSIKRLPPLPEMPGVEENRVLSEANAHKFPTLLQNSHEGASHYSDARPLLYALEKISNDIKNASAALVEVKKENNSLYENAVKSEQNLIPHCRTAISEKEATLRTDAELVISSRIDMLYDEITRTNSHIIDPRLQDIFEREFKKVLRDNNIKVSNQNVDVLYNDLRSRYVRLEQALSACDEYDAHLKQSNNNVDINLGILDLLPIDPTQPVTLKDKAVANRDVKYAILTAEDSTTAIQNLRAKVEDKDIQRVFKANRDTVGTRVLKTLLLVCTFGLSSLKVGLWKTHGAAHTKKVANIVHKPVVKRSRS